MDEGDGPHEERKTIMQIKQAKKLMTPLEKMASAIDMTRVDSPVRVGGLKVVGYSRNAVYVTMLLDFPDFTMDKFSQDSLDELFDRMVKETQLSGVVPVEYEFRPGQYDIGVMGELIGTLNMSTKDRIALVADIKKMTVEHKRVQKEIRTMKREIENMNKILEKKRKESNLLYIVR